ncbi:MAG: disulfide bond formation protein B, partial [Burkholderiaceae bacterium]|nr:disulfide bond formation protein B [Burkholderiaceae bacterium]
MTQLAELGRRATPRALLAIAVAIVVLGIGGGLYFQHVLDLEPCPLCVLQRLAIIGVGLLAALGLLAKGRRGQLAAAVLAALCALTGAGIAAWQSWILVYPPESMSCGRPFEWFHDDFPLAVWLPKLFAGHGDCLQDDWTFLGLAIPHMSLIAFALLVSATVLAARRAWP